MLRREEDHKDHEELRGCFYRGHVRSDERSAVAVNLCDGMVSVTDSVSNLQLFGHWTRSLGERFFLLVRWICVVARLGATPLHNGKRLLTGLCDHDHFRYSCHRVIFAIAMAVSDQLSYNCANIFGVCTRWMWRRSSSECVRASPTRHHLTCMLGPCVRTIASTKINSNVFARPGEAWSGRSGIWNTWLYWTAVLVDWIAQEVLRSHYLKSSVARMNHSPKSICACIQKCHCFQIYRLGLPHSSSILISIKHFKMRRSG